MRLFTPKRDFQLMRHRQAAMLVSALLVLICIVSLALRGLNFSVDFTGGTILEIGTPTRPDTDLARSALEQANLSGSVVQAAGDDTMFIKLPPHEDGQAVSAQALAALSTVITEVELRRVEYVGPQVSEELFTSGLAALLVVAIGIVIYLSLRFKWRMAIGAVVANGHDVIFILGAFSLCGWEFGLPVLAAVLAILGYSVNETVIIFDRLRENIGSSRATANIEQLLDSAITQTWARTIITHGSTQLTVLAMLLFGGATLFHFALALTIGIFSSIYSSVLLSGPVAMWLGLSRADFTAPNKRASDGAIV